MIQGKMPEDDIHLVAHLGRPSKLLRLPQLRFHKSSINSFCNTASIASSKILRNSCVHQKDSKGQLIDKNSPSSFCRFEHCLVLTILSTRLVLSSTQSHFERNQIHFHIHGSPCLGLTSQSPRSPSLNTADKAKVRAF
jgi:hypothetical protein